MIREGSVGASMAGVTSRAEQQKQIIDARRRGRLDVPPEDVTSAPPYHVHGMDILYFLCRFEPETVAAMVPAGLLPAGRDWGLFTAYTAAHGWDIAPFSAFYMGVEVKGFDAPDSHPCIHKVSSYYGDKGFDVFAKYYNSTVRRGWTRISTFDDRVESESGAGDRVLLRMGGRFKSKEFVPLQGINRYATHRPGGGMNIFSMPFTVPHVELAEPFIEIVDGDASGFRAPVEITYSIWCRNSSVTFGIPQPLSAARHEIAEASRSAETVELFGRLGRPAIAIGKKGEVKLVNREAEHVRLQGRLPISDGVFRPNSEGARALTALVEAVAGGDRNYVSARFTLDDGSGPLLAQYLALSDSEIIVFLEDPGRPVAPNSEASLQLLGLTPAEARIAAAVGGGLSPRQAAAELDLSLNTVRSTLKLSFDKLGINRQSELARIVARLAG
jgi:DNA-binding CsgD family transcriptional regulator